MKKIINTKRLIIRLMQLDDFESYVVYGGDPQVLKYIKPTPDLEEVKNDFERYSQPWTQQEGDWMGAGVFLKDSEKLIGDIGFRYKSLEHQQIEIGYKFNHNFQGQGYASEAMQAFVAMIIEDYSFHKLVGYCDPRNVASYKIMERLGMQREGCFKEHFNFGDEWQDELAYGALKRALKV